MTTPPTVNALLAENYWKMLLKIQNTACGLPVNAVFAHYVRVSRFLSAFCPRGGKMRMYGVLGVGKYVSMKHVANLEDQGHAPLGNFDFGPCYWAKFDEICY